MSCILLIGISHHSAPIDLRERVDFCKTGLTRALQTLAGYPDIGESVILSTCNRSELYATCTDPVQAKRTLLEFLTTFHAVSAEALAPHLYSRVDDEAVRHLFRVASGLDSLVVGEPQILGQVKDAYAAAANLQCTGPLLNKLFHSSFATGKRVRSETGLAEGAVSVSYAAVSLARKIFGDLRELNVLVLGAGEMGKLTAVHLKAQPVKRMTIVSRTPAHAEAIAAAIGGTTTSWEDFDPALVSADILVTATGSNTPILSRGQIQRAMQARRNRPLFIIDIAVPRDVDPQAGEIEQVFLYNIDDLQLIVQDNLTRRGSEVDRAESIVADEVRRFGSWVRSREAIPTVVALRQRFEAIRQAELRRLESKMSSLSPEARARVDEITRIIVEKLLLTPTEQLKALSDRETVVAYSDALSRLFSLEADAPPDDDVHPAGAVEVGRRGAIAQPAAPSRTRIG